jgi:glutathione S-transferase
MASVYRIIGSELSPYSVKVRSYFRYKGIPHEWLLRGPATAGEFERHAKLPLIPLVITPDGRGLQDSTPILEAMEAIAPQPSIHPADPVGAFVSALVEEYGDEWGNKPMFHYRWYYQPDQQSAARRIAAQMMPGLEGSAAEAAVVAVRERMVPRLGFVGSSAETRETIERSFTRTLAMLETHLATRPYLFGGRPALGDFGLYAQLYQCSTDPTPGALIRASAPAVLRWIERMLSPRLEGEFEPWAALAPTLRPLLADEIGGLFLPWSEANAQAIGRGEKAFTVSLEGRPWRQEAQRYHAKSLAALRARYAGVREQPALVTLLEETGCARWLG